MRRCIAGLLIIGIALFMLGCGSSDSPIAGPSQDGAPLAKKAAVTEDGGVSPLLVSINNQLAGKNIQVAEAEWLTDAASGIAGKTVYASDRVKQMSSHFVPGDPNRDGRTNITWTIDQTEAVTASGLTADQTNGAIDRCMATWNNLECSTIPLTKMDDLGVDWGYVQNVLGFGGVPGYLYDITHAGWLPAEFFDALEEDGSEYILGVTFTLIWIDSETGEPTDMDGNGKADVAFREIYYNDNFPWQIDANYDVESIALHEVGHGLSQDHFGAIFVTGNNKLHFAPKAVMNAAYTGVQQELTGTDIAGHASIWGSWPNH